MKHCPICHEEMITEVVSTIPGSMEGKRTEISHCPNWDKQWHAEALEAHEQYMANPLPDDFKLNLPVDDTGWTPPNR